jgi:predicted metal-dependent peptidase
MTINKQALDKLTKARTTLLIDQPFFGTLAMRLKLIEDNTIPTLCVDGKEVLYNADFINGLTQKTTQSALAHEVFHCVLDHVGPTGRGITLDPQKFNWAADYVVNDMLVQAGMELGEGWLHDLQYRGKTAEQIYSMIPDPPSSGGSGGSGGNGAPNKGNPGPLDQLKAGSPDPAMQKMQATDWKVAATQAANAAKAVGKLHESMEAFVDQLNKNKVNWREQLRRFIQTAAKNDYSWQRLNRKMQAAGHYLPGLYSEEMGGLFVASDESGSVSAALMAAFGAEISAIKEDLRPEKLTLAHFAVGVGKVEEFGPDDPFAMKRFCSGGTDFRPVMELAVNQATPPMCMVYLTDLYGPFPDVPPDFPVLWVSVTPDLTAPFGETIHIDLDEV